MKDLHGKTAVISSRFYRALLRLPHQTPSKMNVGFWSKTSVLKQ